MIQAESIEDLIEVLGISHKRDFDLNTRSPMKAGGTCDFFLEPNSKEQMVELIKGLGWLEKNFLVVGFLSNVIIRDGRIRTPIIFTGKIKSFRFDTEERAHADAGCSLSNVANELTKKGFEGFSGLSGFPATVGGAIYMNASCYGNAISDYLEYVECVDHEGNLLRFEKDQLRFSWRNSLFHDLPKSFVIISATFKLKPGDTVALASAMNYSKNHRLEYQEHRLPNLGSTFATDNIYREIAKRNFKYRLGFFIMRVAFLWGGRLLFPRKRTKIWAAQINKFTQNFFGLEPKEGVGFSKHTFNCIVNLDGAPATKIIIFIKNVQRKLGILTPLENEIIENIE